MKVTACSGITYRASVAHTAMPKTKTVRPKVLDTIKEPDTTGKNLKQLSYIIGMSMLGISSIILATRGKFCGLRI